MKNFIKSKKGLTIIGIFLFLFIVTVGRNIYFAINFRNNIISGKVVEKYESNLVIEDIGRKTKNISVEPTIEVRKGRETIDFGSLATGTFVLIELDKQDANLNKAMRIRVIDPNAN